MSTEEIKVNEGTVEATQGKQAKQSAAPKKQEKIEGILLRNVKYNGEIKKAGENIELSSIEELEHFVKQGILSKAT